MASRNMLAGVMPRDRVRRLLVLALWVVVTVGRGVVSAQESAPVGEIDTTRVETAPTGTAVPAAVSEPLFPSVEKPAPKALLPIPKRRYGVTSRTIYNRLYVRGASGKRTDSLSVPGVKSSSIEDDELKRMADSLNTRLWLLELQERLLEAEVSGTSLDVGRLRYFDPHGRDYLTARVDLLRHMESKLKIVMREQYAQIDSVVFALDDTIKANVDAELEALSNYVRRNPEGRYVADALFILGQLYYERETERHLKATARWAAESKRHSLGLIPLIPRPDKMNEAVAVPYYRDVVKLGTNRELIPYSLYSLGKYHLELASDYRAGITIIQDSDLHIAELDDDRAKIAALKRRIRELRGLRRAHADTAQRYFSRLIVEFPRDSVNVPEAYFVLASHYNVLGKPADRDTATTYAKALIRGYWHSPRYQDALSLLAQISFQDARMEYRDPAKHHAHYAEGLSYLAWLAREVDAYEAAEVPGVTPETPPMIKTYKRNNALKYMAQVICRPKLLIAPPQAAPATARLVVAAGKSPFGAELLRMVGDRKKKDYDRSDDRADILNALMAYDSLLTYYRTYKDGPKIQQEIIDEGYKLETDEQKKIEIYLRNKYRYFELFNRNGAWARTAVSSGEVSPKELKDADEKASGFLETVAKQYYNKARTSGDSKKLRESLDLFVKYFETYPEKPEAYRLNWQLATELRDLGDFDRAYEQFMRVSHARQEDHRKDAAIEAIAAAQRIIDAEKAGSTR
jgi:TolA-binding protein